MLTMASRRVPSPLDLLAGRVILVYPHGVSSGGPLGSRDEGGDPNPKRDAGVWMEIPVSMNWYKRPAEVGTWRMTPSPTCCA